MKNPKGKNYGLFVALVSMLTLVISCNSPTEPDDDEGSLVPWSKINGKITYSRDDADDGGVIFILDGSVGKVKLVTQKSQRMFINLAWTPDGEKLFYSDFDDNSLWWQLYQIKPDGSGQSVLFPDEAHINYPACSQNGRLAYWYNSTYPHMQEIWIDGESFFTDSMCDQSRPAWSPDGQFMVVSCSDSLSQGSLYKVKLSDKSVTPLLKGTGNWNDEIFHHPIYSPDGGKIVFSKWGGAMNEQSGIWVINSDGTNAKSLTSGYYDWYPAWSPDGSKIAFCRGSGINARIYLMNADGSDVVQVTKNPGEYPVWIE